MRSGVLQQFGCLYGDSYSLSRNILTQGILSGVRFVRIDCGEERIGLSFIHADFTENDEVRAKWEEAQATKAAKKAAREAEFEAQLELKQKADELVKAQAEETERAAAAGAEAAGEAQDTPQTEDL